MARRPAVALSKIKARAPHVAKDHAVAGIVRRVVGWPIRPGGQDMERLKGRIAMNAGVGLVIGGRGRALIG